MTVRETPQAKAHRLLVTGALTVTSVNGDTIRATCRGDSATYELGHHPRATPPWWCGCPARVTCAHLLALQAVTAPQSAHLEHTETEERTAA